MFTTPRTNYLLDLLVCLADLLDLCVRLAIVLALTALSGFVCVVAVFPAFTYLLVLMMTTKQAPGLWGDAVVLVVGMVLALGVGRRIWALEE